MSSDRNERFSNHKMMITKREKRSFPMVREKESQSIQGFYPKIIVNSRASEHVVSDKLYLTDVEEITPVTVELANRTSVPIKKRKIAELDIRGWSTVLFRAYCIP